MQKRTLYLASSSPRRADILRRFNIPFIKIENKLISEKLPACTNNLKTKLIRIAKQKVSASKSFYKGLILGVDTAVILNNVIFGKPQNLADAETILSCLSGKTHNVISACCVLDTIQNKWLCRTDQSKVTFRKLTKKQIQDYCANYNVLDKAGAYAIQEIGNDFILQVKGSYFNIVGLPIERLLKLFKNYDIV
ncbi:Maf family protein [Thermoproteota archaeon]